MNTWIVETKGLKKYYKLGGHIVKALDGVDFRMKEVAKDGELQKAVQT